jgi:Holliday junction resolvasome RuvABC endonuclease subunit
LGEIILEMKEKESFTILSFDPALITGWSVIWHCSDELSKQIHIIASGIIDISKVEGYGNRLEEYRKQIDDLLYFYKPTFIITEEVTFATGNHLTKRLHSGLRAIIAMETYQYNRVEANFMNANTARKLIGVGGNAEKSEVARYLKAMSMAEENPVDWENDNITDSLCLSVALLNEIQGIR